MSETYEGKVVQKQLYKIYKELKSEKQDKLEIMRQVKKYMRPNSEDILFRFKSEVTMDEFQSRALFDNTCQNKMSHFSISSLSDIINPFQPWFTLNIAGLSDEAQQEEEMRTWSIESHAKFLDFINKSTYYKALLSDKRNFDLYGFSAMTIASMGKGKEGMVVKSENPFDVLIYEDDTGVIGVMFEKTYTEYSMKEVFDYEPKEKEKGVKKSYSVICACFPNKEFFIDNAEKEKGKYVQVYILKKVNTSLEGDDKTTFELGSDDSNMAIEIGERKYFKDLVSCVTRDFYEEANSYGEGWGQKLLISAVNLNQVHRNIARTAEFAGNPAFIVPYDLNQRFKHINPGQMYGVSGTGQKIEPIAVDLKLDHLNNFLSVEKEQVNESVPVVGVPQQKKQRQSQLEVEKMLLEASKNSFIYKVIYLQEGVGEHLKRMFRIAVDQGVLDEPPGNIDIGSVEPNLNNIILKELKKAQARSFVEGLNLSNGFLALVPEGGDNYKVDKIIRSIMEAVGGGEGLENMKAVEQIRQQRQRIQQGDLGQQNQLTRADVGLKGAQADKAHAEAQKVKAEAQQQEGVL